MANSFWKRSRDRFLFEARELGFSLRGFCGLIVVLLCLSQLAAFTGRLAVFSTHRAIVEAIDNDAGEGVKVAGRSHWITDNSFRYYGPLYFRIAQTSSWAFFSPEALPEAQYERERGLHFALLFVSLLSLYALGWILTGVFTKDWILRGVGMFLLTPAFLVSPVWSQYLFTVHPDLFLTFVCTAGVLASLRMAAAPEEAKRWKTAAFWWALALSTKLSSLFFMPAQLYYLWTRDRRLLWQRCKQFTLFTLVVYLIVGFPQNFDFYENLRTLFGLSKYSVPFTWGSFAQWWTLWGAQVVWPLVVLIGFAFLVRAFPDSRSQEPGTDKWSWGWAPAVLFGMLVLSVRSLELVHDYYVFPFVGAGLAAAATWIHRWDHRRLVRDWRLRLGFAAVGLWIGAVPYLQGLAMNQQTLVRLQTCKGPQERGFQTMFDIASGGGKIVATPYTPVPALEPVETFWELNDEKYEKAAPARMIFNRSYYERYTKDDEPNSFVKKNNSEWPKTQAFYRRFEGKNEVTASDGRVWKLVSDEGQLKCSIEIWEPK